MDGNRPTGIGHQSLNTHIQQEPVEEVVHARRSWLNRQVRKLTSAFSRTPKRQGRVPKADSLKHKIITTDMISKHQELQHAGIIKKPAGAYLTSIVALEPYLTQGKGRSSRAISLYQHERNKILAAGLILAHERLAGSKSEGSPEFTAGLQALIRKYQEQFSARPPSEITIEMVRNLSKLALEMPEELTLNGISEEKEIVTDRLQQIIEGGETDVLLKATPILHDRDAQLKPKSANSFKELFKLQKLHINSALAVLQNEMEELRSAAQEAGFDMDKALEGHIKLESRLNERIRQLEMTMVLKGDNKPSKGEQKSVKADLPKELSKELVSVGLDKAKVKRAMKAAYIDQLNNRNWEVVDKSFSLAGKDYQSVQVPAAKMRFNSGASDAGEEVFSVPYEQGGVCCVDNTNTKHATNLWRSDFVVNGKKVFTGIRHGIHTPYGLTGSKDKAALKAGALQKTQESVIAALVSQPELYQQALTAAEAETNDDIEEMTPTLTLSSISLVTTGLGSSAENRMQKAQNQAFQTLADSAVGGRVLLDVPAPEGGTRKVAFKLRQARFNIPVNFGGVGAVSVVTGGRITQSQMNDKAMDEMFGSSEGFGFVDDYVNRTSSQLSKLREERKTLQEGDASVQKLDKAIKERERL